MAEKNKTHVINEEEMIADPEKAALFTTDAGEEVIKPEISKKTTVAFTERERLWEGMK